MGTNMSRRIEAVKNAATVTPADGVSIGECRGIYVGTSGDLAVIMGDSDTAVVFPSLAAGVIHPINPHTVESTDTTAADIVRVW